eukprot:1161757-Pelagomonas_calceolata.AAC.6
MKRAVVPCKAVFSVLAACEGLPELPACLPEDSLICVVQWRVRWGLYANLPRMAMVAVGEFRAVALGDSGSGYVPPVPVGILGVLKVACAKQRRS